jgi:hypothetical protein
MRVKKEILFLLIITAVLLAACGGKTPACPDGSIIYIPALTPFPTSSPGDGNLSTSAQVSIQIKGKEMKVDRIIHGPLCNDNWNGKIYVACDVQVYEWLDKPTFLDGCSLNITPGTVVYVAAHNDSAYYNGCSACHTSAGEGN